MEKPKPPPMKMIQVGGGPLWVSLFLLVCAVTALIGLLCNRLS